METELQHFLNQCLDIIELAVEVEPVKIFDLFVSTSIDFNMQKLLKNHSNCSSSNTTRIKDNLKNLLPC